MHIYNLPTSNKFSKQRGFAGFVVVAGVLLLLSITAISGSIYFNPKAKANIKTLLSDLTGSISPDFLGATSNSITYKIDGSSYVINQDGDQVTKGTENFWVGNGQSADKSYLAFTLKGDSLSDGQTFSKATLSLSPKSTQWIQTDFSISLATSAIKDGFSDGQFVSSLDLSSGAKTISENVKWTSGKSYSYDVTDLVKAALENDPKTSAYTFVLKGTGQPYSRKFLSTGKSNSSPTLIVEYTSEVAVVTPTPTPTPVATPTPTPTPTATPTPTPVATPTPTPVVTPTPTPTPVATVTPTPVPTMPMPMPTPNNSGEAASFGIWDPSLALYTPSGTSKYPTCSKATHDSYYVIGPNANAPTSPIQIRAGYTLKYKKAINEPIQIPKNT
jgi:hypothetical protein